MDAVLFGKKPKWFFAIWIIVLIGLIFVFSDNLTGYSIDLVYHYRLVNQIGENSSISPSSLESDQQAYPLAAHAIASLLNKFTSSSLTSMNMLSIFSLFTIYAIVSFYLISNGLLTFILGSSVFFLLALFGRNVPIFGFEIVGNFFFSQLVSQSYFLIFIFILSSIDLNSWWLKVASLLILYVGFCIHTTLGLVYIGTTFLLFLHNSISSENGTTWKKLLSDIVYLLLCLLIFFFHPYTKNMVNVVAGNNGSLPFVFLAKNDTIEPLGYVILFMSFFYSLIKLAVLIKEKRNDPISRKNFSVYAYLFSSVALAVLQLAVLYLGKGSLYAVKKYFFSIFSFLAIAIFIDLGRLINPLLTIKLKSITKSMSTKSICAILLPMLLVAAILTKKIGDINNVKRLQNIARTYNSFWAPDETINKTIAILDDHPTVNYLISVSDLNFFDKYQAYEILFLGQKSIQGTYIFTKDRIQTEKSLLDLGRYRVYRAEDYYNTKLGISSSILFNQERNAQYLNTGFSFTEKWGTWTADETAKVKFLVEKPIGDIKVVFTVSPWLVHGHDEFETEIIVNGELKDKIHFDNKNKESQKLQVNIRKEEISRTDEVEITFRFSNLKSPKDLGLSQDDRKISLGFIDMKVEKK